MKNRLQALEAAYARVGDLVARLRNARLLVDPQFIVKKLDEAMNLEPLSTKGPSAPVEELEMAGDDLQCEACTEIFYTGVTMIQHKGGNRCPLT